MNSISFPLLPTLGSDLAGGTYQGVTTLKDGSFAAVVLLPKTPQKRTSWVAAMALANNANGQLPTRHIYALLFCTAKDQFDESEYYWTGDEHEDGSNYAWCFYPRLGLWDCNKKDSKGFWRAIRLIPLSG